MQLILVRHGEAEPYQTNDAIRNLTARGVIQAHSTAEQVLAKYHPDLFVVSPFKRAQQTIAAFQSKSPQVPLHILEGITPDADPRAALDALSRLSEQYSAKCIVVVCHMNVVAYMAALLIEEDPENFGLAEARIFEQSILEQSGIVMGLSVEKARFLPIGDLS